MDSLALYKKDLELLKSKKAQVEVKLQSCKTEAVEIKKRLESLGYSSLDEAREDYARRAGELSEKHAQVKSLIKQIDAAEVAIPSKEKILEDLKASIKDLMPKVEKDIQVEKMDEAVEDLKEDIVTVPEDTPDDMFGSLGL